jgi:hypothetical protein
LFFAFQNQTSNPAPNRMKIKDRNASAEASEARSINKAV